MLKYEVHVIPCKADLRWPRYSQQVGVRTAPPTPACPSLLEEFLERPPSQSSLGQPSFQERVVGLAPVPARKSSASEDVNAS